MPESLVDRVEELFVERWGIFRPQFENWPAPITRALQDLDLWLADESIIHMQVTHEASDASYGLVEDATELSLFMLTERFAVLVTIPREDGGVFRKHTRYQVKRAALKELTTSLPQLRGLFEGLTFDLTYEGFPRAVSIKLSDSRLDRPTYEQEREFFAVLRDDFYAEPGE